VREVWIVRNIKDCRVEERPDGFYVVHGDKAIGPYESALLPEAGRRRIRLNEIRAGLHGRKARVRVRVVGMSDPMAIPRFLKIDCECGCGDAIDLLSEREFITLRNYLFNRLCSYGKIGRLVE